jgi:iron complex transport system substrate-binding protein
MGNGAGYLAVGERDRMTRHPVRMIPRRFLILLFVLLVLPATPMVLADLSLPQADGGSLALAAPAKRIITLAPNLTELVFAAGAGDRLVAVVEYSNYPPEARQIPRVGDAFRVDLERIAELEPDLVIAWKSGNPQAALQKLTQLDISVWQIEITRPQEIPAAVENISRAAGSETIGRPAARQMRQRLKTLKHRNADKTPVDYFYQVAARPLYTVSGNHIISRSLEICGGVNVFSELPALAPQVTVESVIVVNPQAMIAPDTKGEIPALASWSGWPRLQATQNNNFIYLPADEISQATPRLLDSMELACELLDRVRAKQIHASD